MTVTRQHIEQFHDQFGAELLAKAQDIVDETGGPQIGFVTISVDTIMVAMLLCGSAGLGQMG